jgi:molybdenum cofactor cytidylyltransferase
LNEHSGIMLALLAAGQSRRFGNQDKLSAMLDGKMLGLHAAEAGSEMPFVEKWVIAPPDHRCAAGWRDLGYQIIANEDAAQGQATSVRIAADRAIQSGASGLCILLADMPFVTGVHLGKLLAAFAASGGIVASARDRRAMPPAIFSFDSLKALTLLQGDAGARGLLADARLVAGDDHLLMDIDTAEDLLLARGKTERPD